MRYVSWSLAATGLLLPWLAFAPAAEKAPQQQTTSDVQDVVFLGEARPVFLRLHVRVDGKPIQDGYDDFMKHLFRYLDVNGDGVLSKDEAERAPTLEQIEVGIIGRGIGGGGRGGRGAVPAAPSMADLDADKDGKVTLAELSAYYRKQGFLPFQLQLDGPPANPLGGAAAFFGGGKTEPSVEAVSEAIFTLLDANKDGKLTPDELAAAPALLLKLDEDDDEIVTAREVAPNTRPANGLLSGMMAMAGGGGRRCAPSTGNHLLVPVSSPGEVPAELLRRLHERYGPKGVQAQAEKLTRKDLGLDEATFALLDTNKDGVLDAAELAGFVKRAPDLELVVRVGSKEADQRRVDIATVKGGPSPLARHVKLTNGLALLDLGLTRAEVRGSDDNQADGLGGLIQQQFIAQFKQADKDGNGYLDEKAARASRLFGGLFKAIDRDGDGKIYEKELIAYLDHLTDLKTRARSACVTLVLSDQSRGLFDALDVNRDGKLGLREIRGAANLLAQLDRGGKGYLTKADIPRSYQITLRGGPVQTGGLGGAAVFAQLYSGAGASEGPAQATAGPLWFRKMDRNRDGDVSRREFLGTDEQFRAIDTDGDGLISLAEAERHDARLRKRK